MQNRRQRSSSAAASSPFALQKKEDQEQDTIPNVLVEKQVRFVDNWILKYHNEWSGLTLNTFYQDLSKCALSAPQYTRWLLDITSTSIAVVEGAKRTADIVRASVPDIEFPLLRIATEDARFLTEFAILWGLDINSDARLSSPGARLVQLIEASTAPDAPPAVAITAIWAYMLATWQSWELCCSRGEPIPAQFERIAQHITRKDTFEGIDETERILDRLFKSPEVGDQFEKAGKTFEEIARRSAAVLEHTTLMSDESNIPVCTCGRKGHYPGQCTFKSHI
ncbi:hypothetical protein BWQ96_01283 [Gracilariopsis chorda]|uniref:Uncharacterized protein n=1 Tax=Gracilariopsis chorda TaxID=448386 RepID=A0A2V3J3C1_9FLOR|nr:hypothetical protein BWQ96_01283 [Gracilariopsis chorda]|eukprot:PXF48941.1 hypothetical protein BWQ96_01283 [Gracilariopsis chorda]